MVRHLLVTQLLLSLLVSSGCTATTPTNASVFDGLWKALESKDRSALPLVEMVLQDSLNHRDRFNHETRTTAFEVLRETNLTELLPLVRQVAAMDYRPFKGKGDLNDLVAIEEALITLREWNDPSTIELSLRRLDAVSWLQTVAVNNLRLLEHWHATPDVQKLLDQAPKDLEHLVTIRESVGYLQDSPETDPGACDSLMILPTSFPFCFKEDDREHWRCGTLNEDTRSLKSRLGCVTN